MAIKRIDLLNASKLLAKEGLTRPGDMDNTAGLMLGVNYLVEKRDGKTELTFKEWLEGDFEGDELNDKDDDGESEADPTEGS